ncbi:acyltransferase family protein [Flavobacterium rhizosphaerae]|uniref:Acyltransferase n=1 Tax=Flavobacterium rhizosphaerae TaxID=3163298 RepID=A0ABW8YWE6_9FLAO
MADTIRFYQIDFLRFIAALSVLLFHYTFHGYTYNESEIYYPEIASVLKYGYFGVHLFFIISGYVILLSINDRNTFNFIKSRITRLYPAYWFCVTLTFLCIYFFGQSYFSVNFKDYITNLTMFQQIVGVKHIDGVYWTLTIELKFYSLITIYLLINYFKKINIDYFVAIWLLITLSFNFFQVEKFTLINLFLNLYGYNSLFLAGMIIYRIQKNGNKLLYIIELFLCFISSILLAEREAVYLSLHHHEVYISKTVVYILFIIFYIVFYLISQNKLKVLNKSYFLKLGLLTYPLYLIHQNIGYMIINHLHQYINKYLLLILLICFMLFLAYLINNKVEKPFSKFLKEKIETLRDSFKGKLSLK